MPDAIFPTDLLLQPISHAILHKPTDLLVANYPPQSAQQKATVMEAPDLLTVVAAPIQIGPHQIVQNTVWIVCELSRTTSTDLYLSNNCVVVAKGAFSNIYPCTAGLYTTEFCCSATPATSNCCKNKFEIKLGKPYLKMIHLLQPLAHLRLQTHCRVQGQRQVPVHRQVLRYPRALGLLPTQHSPLLRPRRSYRQLIPVLRTPLPSG